MQLSPCMKTISTTFPIAIAKHNGLEDLHTPGLRSSPPGEGLAIWAYSMAHNMQSCAFMPMHAWYNYKTMPDKIVVNALFYQSFWPLTKAFSWLASYMLVPDLLTLNFMHTCRTSYNDDFYLLACLLNHIAI